MHDRWPRSGRVEFFAHLRVHLHFAEWRRVADGSRPGHVVSVSARTREGRRGDSCYLTERFHSKWTTGFGIGFRHSDSRKICQVAKGATFKSVSVPFWVQLLGIKGPLVDCPRAMDVETASVFPLRDPNLFATVLHHTTRSRILDHLTMTNSPLHVV